MDKLVNELDSLLGKYHITIYEAMKIYEKSKVQTLRLIQCYEDSEKVWQYYDERHNPCGCGSNCYHFEYDRITEEIFGVCNCCNKEIYVVKKEYKDDKLKQGKWLNKDWKFVREKL